MASLNVQIVRPDRLVWEGEVEHLVLHTRTGEMGIYPGHAPAIVALGDGVTRVHEAADPEHPRRVIISGGYVEVTPKEVIILANHARRVDDVRRDSIDRTLAKAEAHLAELPEGDHRRLYWNEKIAWQNLLLEHGVFPDS